MLSVFNTKQLITAGDKKIMGADVIGIDVGGTMIKGGLFDEHGTLIKKESLPKPNRPTRMTNCF